jgi:hypothetical protein
MRPGKQCVTLKSRIFISSTRWPSYLPADVSGIDLNKQLLEMIVQNPKMTLHNVVAEVLSYEAKKLMR